MQTFRQTRRQRLEPGVVPLVVTLVQAARAAGSAQRHGVVSTSFAVQLAGFGFFAGLVVFGLLDQRAREVVIDEHGVRTRRLWHSASIPWRTLVDVEARRSWVGDQLVATTAMGPVTLDAPYLFLVRSRTARRQFDEAAAELQRVIERRAV
jgi:hypothetical protein